MGSSIRLLHNSAWFGYVFAHLVKFFPTLADSVIGKLFLKDGVCHRGHACLSTWTI